MGMATVTEAAFTRQVIDLAMLHGWLVTHFGPARTKRGWRTAIMGHAGFPDLVMTRHGQLLFVELKVGRNTLTLAQQAWMAALRDVRVYNLAGSRGIIVETWRPEDWPAIESVLGAKP
jgi:hypothetical protein